jgi:hypothetical protein
LQALDRAVLVAREPRHRRGVLVMQSLEVRGLARFELLDRLVRFGRDRAARDIDGGRDGSAVRRRELLSHGLDRCFDGTRMLGADRCELALVARDHLLALDAQRTLRVGGARCA